MKVIWAYDNVLPKAGSTTLEYHDHRGVKNLYLKDPKTDKPTDNDVSYWDVITPSVSIIYICTQMF